MTDDLRTRARKAAECVFCARIANNEFDGGSARTVVHFEPLDPVTSGHRLFVPGQHAEHPDELAVGNAMAHAEQWGRESREDFNLITSSGHNATQTVPHIHVHYVPRRRGDGLPLPWTAQQTGHLAHAAQQPTLDVDELVVVLHDAACVCDRTTHPAESWVNWTNYARAVVAHLTKGDESDE